MRIGSFGSRVAWVLALGVLFELPLVARAQSGNDPRAIEARTRFDEAERIFDAGDYAGALAEFERIYELLEGHPQRYFVFYNMGRCQEGLFRYGDALASYQRYLNEGGSATDLAPTVRQKLRELEARLAVVTIRTNVGGAEVWVDGRHVGSAPGAIRVTGGSHTIELRARGYAPGRRDVQIAARTQVEVAMDLDRAGAGLDPVLFITSASLTGAFAAVGTILGLLALAEHDALAGQLMSSDDAVRFTVTEARISAMQTLAGVADVFFAAAILGAIVSSVFVFVTDFGSTSGSASGPRLAPFIAETGGGLLLEGRL